MLDDAGVALYCIRWETSDTIKGRDCRAGHGNIVCRGRRPAHSRIRGRILNNKGRDCRAGQGNIVCRGRRPARSRIRERILNNKGRDCRAHKLKHGKHMGNIISDIRKTYHYLRKNGVLPTYYTALERLEQRRAHPYVFVPTPEEELAAQREYVPRNSICFSILVPAYETVPEYLRAMIDSCLAQTYGRFELIIADASLTDTVQKTCVLYNDDRIKYIRLENNGGISVNTNRALDAASGDYISLLDHDDFLEPDALYHTLKAIEDKKAEVIFTDEDKYDGETGSYYEPNIKGGFNKDLLLSNNYICHFLTVKAQLIRMLRLRPEYDGAQDYDLILRCVRELRSRQNHIVPVPKVLYHWRCHRGSTAQNPQSKLYAYEAGRRALSAYLAGECCEAEVVHTKHLGFYHVYYKDIFRDRSDVGAVCGFITEGGRIAGGAYDSDGRVVCGGLKEHYSGYMNRASLQQNVYAPDLRRASVRPELIPVRDRCLEENRDIRRASLDFAAKTARFGYIFLLDPEYDGGRQ